MKEGYDFTGKELRYDWERNCAMGKEWIAVTSVLRFNGLEGGLRLSACVRNLFIEFLVLGTIDNVGIGIANV
jgi:hypothetical protein